jgi:CRISPR type I-E-associated protein CasB/Cse2
MNQPNPANEAREARKAEARAVIAFLARLRDDPHEGNAAMAIFRRGLSERAADIEKMQRYLHHFMREEETSQERWREQSMFLLASLFALYKNAPKTDEGNMGDHFAEARTTATSPEAIERRFSALLSAHHEDLPVYLRRAIAFLKSQEVGINWTQLLHDVWDWPHHTRGEARRREWARRFWLQKRKDESDTPAESSTI